jgi:hypothetical protein
MTEQHRCPGCGSMLPIHDGPTHDYMLSSPACWAVFGEVLAREYSNPALMDIHRLTVDTWAVQHPGDGSRRAVQSVAMHLCRIRLQLEDGYAGMRANDAMLRLSTLKSELPELPPRPAYSMTVADVRNAIDPGQHAEAVRRWAGATWDDWSDQHDFVAGYLARVGLSSSRCR